MGWVFFVITFVTFCEAYAFFVCQKFKKVANKTTTKFKFKNKKSKEPITNRPNKHPNENNRPLVLGMELRSWGYLKSLDLREILPHKKITQRSFSRKKLDSFLPGDLSISPF